MELKTSPFSSPFPSMPAVDGVQLSAIAAGLRYKGREDMALFAFDEGTVAAGVFTKNTVKGHPVVWNQRLMERGSARALVVNAGNANVFTGKQGYMHTEDTARSVAAELDVVKRDVFVGSTGVIGEPLPIEKLKAAIPTLCASLTHDAWEQTAKAISTTDTFIKGVTKTISVEGQTITLNGIAKGSGMVEPNMATMLAYIFTDATIEAPALQAMVQSGLGASFNAITVDSDTSTSDMLMAFATNKSSASTSAGAFETALHEVMRELALMVVKDGEGISKFITINVNGAESDESARIIGKSVANSPLVKTAIAGEDPNWGRILMAIGKCGEPIDDHKCGVLFGDIIVAENGARAQSYTEKAGADYFKQDTLNITIDCGLFSTGSATVYTSDLTHDYISINADYRS